MTEPGRKELRIADFGLRIGEGVVEFRAGLNASGTFRHFGSKIEIKEGFPEF
jgi:hypothetical protein